MTECDSPTSFIKSEIQNIEMGLYSLNLVDGVICAAARLEIFNYVHDHRMRERKINELNM